MAAVDQHGFGGDPQLCSFLTDRFQQKFIHAYQIQRHDTNPTFAIITHDHRCLQVSICAFGWLGTGCIPGHEDRAVWRDSRVSQSNSHQSSSFR